MKKKWSAIILCIISMTIFRYISYIFLGKQMPIHYLLYYFPFLILGTTFCKYKLLEKLTYKKNTLSLILYLTIVTICLYIRIKTGYSEILFILVPCFILIFIQKPIPNILITKILTSLGQYSMGIWLLHSFFIKQIPLQKISNNCILHLILILGICYLISYTIEKIYSIIRNKIYIK